LVRFYRRRPKEAEAAKPEESIAQKGLIYVRLDGYDKRLDLNMKSWA
jgi:hypothetical protein